MPEWEQVALGEVLKRADRFETRDETANYDFAGVYSYARGVFKSTTRHASTFKLEKIQRIKTGDFVYSKIMAWEGAFGIVPSILDDHILSGAFVSYTVDPNRLLPEFLDLYFQQKDVWKSVGAQSSGTNVRRQSLHPDIFEATTIPLPPLPEQRRIVARVQGLLAKVEEVRGLREQTRTQLHDLISVEELKLWPESDLLDAPSLEQVTAFLSRGRQSAQGNSSHRLIKTQNVQMGHYVPTHARLSPDVAEKVKPEAIVKQGDTLIACSAAGCLGRVAQYNDDTGIETSTDTHIAIARPDLSKITPDYLYAYLRGAQGQYQLRSRERGDWQREKVGFRFTELNVADMRRIPIPTPSLDEQRRIVSKINALREQVVVLDNLQTVTQTQLDALPSSILARAFAGAL